MSGSVNNVSVSAVRSWGPLQDFTDAVHLQGTFLWRVEGIKQFVSAIKDDDLQMRVLKARQIQALPLTRG
jgi:hypothetical protein